MLLSLLSLSFLNVTSLHLMHSHSSIHNIKEMTAGDVRQLILEKNDFREVKETKQEGKMTVKQGKTKSIDRYCR